MPFTPTKERTQFDDALAVDNPLYLRLMPWYDPADENARRHVRFEAMPCDASV